MRRRVTGPRSRTSTLAALVGALLVSFGPATASAQYAIASPEGDSLAFEIESLRVMLDTARALRTDLEVDPRVLYRLGFGPAAEVEAPASAYPWNAVTPDSDSTVTIQTPGNLREADRAYHNYAVMRMREIRGFDPDDPCDELVEREARVLASFIDGWIVARTLFGGPAFAPLDELAFARSAGHLEALIAARRNASVGVCAAQWAAANVDDVSAYEAWRESAFPGLVGAPDVMPQPADTVGADEEALPVPLRTGG